MFTLRLEVGSCRNIITVTSDLKDQAAFSFKFAKKERPREAKQLAQGHTACQWQNMTPFSLYSITQPPVRLMAGGFYANMPRPKVTQVRFEGGRHRFLLLPSTSPCHPSSTHSSRDQSMNNCGSSSVVPNKRCRDKGLQ